MKAPRFACRALCALCLWALAQLPPARAEEHRAASAEPQLVVVDYPNTSFTDPELHAAVRELLSRIQLQVVSLAHPGEGEVVAYAHILMGPDEVTVTVEDARGGRPPARRSVTRADSPAVLRETLAHVLLGLVEPLAEARAPASEQGLDDRQASARHRRRAAWVPQLGVHGGPTQLANGYWSARFAGSGALAWDRRLTPALGLDLGATLPVTVDEQGVQARVWLVNARLRARITPLTLGSVAFDAAVSGGVDMFTMHPVSAGGDTSLEGSDREFQPILGFTLGARSRLRRNMDLVFGLGLDLDPKQRTWLLETGTTTQRLFATTHLRPYATLGIDWRLPGEVAR